MIFNPDAKDLKRFAGVIPTPTHQPQEMAFLVVDAVDQRGPVYFEGYISEGQFVCGTLRERAYFFDCGTCAGEVKETLEANGLTDYTIIETTVSPLN